MAYKIISPIPLVEGGTGAQTFSSYGVVCGGLAPTDPLETIATGGVGHLLMANGAAKPAFVSFGTVWATSAVTVTVLHGGTGVNAITAHNLVIGNGTGAITLLPPHATAGIPLVSAGAAADPAYGTAVVPGGGTGNTTFTAYSVICAGATATGAFQNVVGVGAAGEVLASNGAGALPSWQALSGLGVTSVNSQIGAVTISGGTTGASFTGAAGTVTMTFAGITANGGVVSLGTDATDNAINIGTNASAGRTIIIGNAVGTSSVSLNCGTGGVSVGTSANNHTTTLGSVSGTSYTILQAGSTGIDITATNGPIDIQSGTGTISLSTDAAATTVNIATGAAVKTVTMGSTITTSQLVLQSGTNGININSHDGGLVINSGTGALSISNDASATTVNIATGGAAKVATLGSTSGASSLALQYGTADFSLASATGTVMSALDSGEITCPLQPAFLGRLNSSLANVTGDGTSYTVVLDTEVFDQGSDYDLTEFTAPVDGKYAFSFSIRLVGIGASHTDNQQTIYTSNRSYFFMQSNPTANDVGGYIGKTGSVLADMDAGDVAGISVYVANSTKTVSVNGNATHGLTNFSGHLVC